MNPSLLTELMSIKTENAEVNTYSIASGLANCGYSNKSVLASSVYIEDTHYI
jgi:hypothetical protein